jgi:hypothetical protein
MAIAVRTGNIGRKPMPIMLDDPNKTRRNKKLQNMRKKTSPKYGDVLNGVKPAWT